MTVDDSDSMTTSPIEEPHEAPVENAATSAAVEAFAEAILDAPWGSVAKSELDLLIFTLLMDSGKLGNKESDFALAEMLSITPARVRTLRFRYDQRKVRNDPLMLVPMMVPANFSFGEPDNKGYFEVSIHSTYLREYFSSRLVARRSVIYVRTPAVLTINREEFVRIVIDAVCGTQWSESPEGLAAYGALLTELVASQDQAAANKTVGRILGAGPQILTTLDSAFASYREISRLFINLFGIK